MKIYALLLLGATGHASAFSAVPQQQAGVVNSLEAILFDCDGVLADTERDGHRISFNIAFDENGIKESWDEQRYGKLLEVGGGKERMTAHWVSVIVLCSDFFSVEECIIWKVHLDLQYVDDTRCVHKKMTSH